VFLAENRSQEKFQAIIWLNKGVVLMEIEIIKNEKNDLKFYLIGERHTLPSLLKSRLLDDKSVEFVSYKLEHPLEDKSVFIVKTKGKSSKKALQDAVKEIQKELKEMGTSLKKALK
jgi:DNA-directed RNA polymerase subunit L